MTTIAWDGKTLAADRLETGGGTVTRYVKKIQKTPVGCAAATGSIDHCESFVDWCVGDRRGEFPRIPETEEGFCGIAVIDGEIFECYANLHPIKIEGVRAWGSGWKLALAAMDHGKTAVEAVKYAATRDIYTGGKVDHYEVKV